MSNLKSFSSDILLNIFSYLPYINFNSILNKDLLNELDWSNISLLTNTDLDLTRKKNTLCNFITNPDKRIACNIYINKCRIKQLYLKYLDFNHPESQIYSINIVNSIFLRRIGNTNCEEAERDLNDLVLFGSTIIGLGTIFFINDVTSITIPRTISYIGDFIFCNRKLKYILIPNSVKRINKYAFNRNQLRVVNIPDSVTYIDKFAFAENQLNYVNISNSLTIIEENVFSHNKITEIVIPDSVKSINIHAFYNNHLTSLVIPDSVTNIGYGAFEKNKLTDVVIPDSVTRIGKCAFYNNNNLMNVTIPARFTNRIHEIFDVSTNNINFTFF